MPIMPSDVVGRRHTNMWFDNLDVAPKDGTSVLLYNEEWEDEDFNPTGVMDGYWDEFFDGYLHGTWVVAGWNSCSDSYQSFSGVPTHWAPKVSPRAPKC